MVSNLAIIGNEAEYHFTDFYDRCGDARMGNHQNSNHYKSILFLTFFIAITVVLIFYPCTKFEFLIWDDDRTIYDNVLVKNFSFTSISKLFHFYPKLMTKYAPLYWVSLGLVHSASGFDPHVYHTINVLMHIASSVVLFLILFRSLSALDRSGNGPLWAAFLATLFWSIHPMRAEVVCGATNLSYCQAILFLFLSFYLFMKFEDTDHGSRVKQVAYYFFSFTLFTASLFTFPIGMTFFAVLVFYAFFVHNPNNKKISTKIIINIPYAIVAFIVISLNLYNHTYLQNISPFGLKDIIKFPYLIFYYIATSIVPLNLSPNNIQFSKMVVSDPVIILSAFAALVFGIVTIKRRKPWVGIFLLFVIVLLPLLKTDDLPQRYSYLSGAFLSALAGYFLLIAYNRRNIYLSMLASLFTIVYLLILLPITSAQIAIRENNVAFFHYILDMEDDSIVRSDAYWRMGKAYQEREMHEDALHSFEESLQEWPSNLNSLYSAAIIKLDLGRQDEAQNSIDLAEFIYKNSPFQISEERYANYHFFIGNKYFLRQNFTMALEHYFIAKNSIGYNALLPLQIGMTLFNLGRYEESILYVKEASQLDPESPFIQSILSRVHAELGKSGSKSVPPQGAPEP